MLRGYGFYFRFLFSYLSIQVQNLIQHGVKYAHPDHKWAVKPPVHGSGMFWIYWKKFVLNGFAVDTIAKKNGIQ